MQPELFTLMAEAQRDHWWFRGRRAVLRQLLRRHLPAGALQLLELGCGTGGNLQLLAEFGEVTAVELDATARDYARRTSGLDVHAGALPAALPAFDRRFDAICLFDVLEHIEDDAAALGALRGLLAPGGRIILTVPAYQWLYGAHDRQHHHFRRYTVMRLARLAHRAGLTTECAGYFNTLLFPLAALTRLIAAVLPGEHAPGVGLPPAPLNALLHGVFATEARWLPQRLFPFGTSVAAVLKAAC